MQEDVRKARKAAGLMPEGTHGAADTPSYDWMKAIIDSRSVEEIIGAATDRLPALLIERLRHLRSYDRVPAKGRKHMCAESLKASLVFFINHRMPPPTIVETLEGNVILEWNVAGDRYLCIEFVGDTQIVYFLFILGQTRIKGRIFAGELVDRIPLDAVKGWYYGTTRKGSFQ